MIKRRVLLVFLSLFLLSCTAPLKTLVERYEEAPLCCKSFKEFEYEKIEVGEKKKFWIDGDSKAFVFDRGKSFFKAFELPEYQEPYSILIKSYFIGDRPAKFYLFSPEVIFLDEDFEVTRKIDGRFFGYTKTFLERTLKAETTVSYPRDRYMIILTTKELLEKKTEITVPITMPIIFSGIMVGIPMGVDLVKVPHSPVGKIKIELKPLAAGP